MRLSIVLVLVGILGCSQAVSVDEKGIAPDFTLSSIDGGQVSLSDFRGQKDVLAVFWATWCPYCVEEIPSLNKMAEEGKVTVLGIDIKEGLEKVSSFAQKKEIKYKILLDPDGNVAQGYGVVGIPLNVLIDKEGRIIYKGHSIEEVERILKSGA